MCVIICFTERQERSLYILYNKYIRYAILYFDKIGAKWDLLDLETII